MRATLACAVLATVLVPRGAAAAFDRARAACVVEAAAEKLLATDARLAPGAYPDATGPDGLWRTKDAGDELAWTQGFFPGSMWLLYDAKREEKWASRARAWTAPLAVQRSSALTHDVGFRLVPSFGQMARLTGDADARQVLLDGAAALATRFEEAVGAIRCCDWNPAWHVPVVVETLVNLELLYWSAANGGPARHREVALSHALRSLDLVRPDGSTFQVADYAADGALLSRGTYQGASDASTWARGQAWAMKGFGAAYRATRDPRMLEAARRVTAYWLERAPADGVPRWDFDAPDDVKDTSAAAVAASALLGLAALVEGEEAARYREAALRALDALTSEAWIDSTGGEALLRGGAGDRRAGRDVNVGLVYRDHHLLEAVLRAFPEPGACEPAPPGAPADPEPPPAQSPRGGSSGGCTTGETGSVLAIAAAILALVRRRS